MAKTHNLVGVTWQNILVITNITDSGLEVGDAPWRPAHYFLALAIGGVVAATNTRLQINHPGLGIAGNAVSKPGWCLRGIITWRVNR